MSEPTAEERAAEVYAALRGFSDEQIRTIAAALHAHAAAEREAIIGIIRYLDSNSQRAVSWHEVQDCIAAIRKRGEHR